MVDLQNLEAELTILITSQTTLLALEQAKSQILGKNSKLQAAMSYMSNLSHEDKKNHGKIINQIKTNIQDIYSTQQHKLQALALEQQLEAQWQDLSLPARKTTYGKIHPLTQATNEMIAIFAHLGFSIAEGPNIESDWYNFSALNIDENHPARQMHDTFYVKVNEQNHVLRTHTSPVQIRTMEKTSPPFRFISPGRVYRCDWDATHTPMFHQLEGVVVDEKIHMGHLKYLVNEFINLFFEKTNLAMRFRSSYFPFTEPSAEVDIKCKRSANELILGQGDDWLEVMGCGMIHPQVLENVGIDANKYQGFAFGLGIERFAMLKYGISDLREFYNGDKRWLDHYGFTPFDIPSIVGGLTK